MQERLEVLAAERERVSLGGGQAKIDKQHDKGRLTARERVARLVDEGTFRETGMFATHRTTHFGMDKADAPADGYAHLLLGRTLQRGSRHDEATPHLRLAAAMGVATA